ncbi:adenosine tri phosphatase [Perkinsus sp. BL_2016]|nr:adenosine tri phosphatase [Perkinsus sp. BL_2016]
MSVNKFVDALLGSKMPSVSADQQYYSTRSNWSSQDARALGEISIVMHVKIFDNGDWLNPKIHPNSFDGYLMFMPGALLISRCNVDYAEVFANGSLDKNAYFKLYERRLLPLLRFANDESKAKNKNAVVTIPSIGCGKFSGGYFGIINEFNAMLERLLQKYAPQLPNISLVYFAHFSDKAISVKTPIYNMKYHRVSNKHMVDYKQLLETPSSYSIDGQDYKNHLLFAFVASDHLSYPGNNFFFSMPVRNTDDGVKAAATSSMTSLLGVNGHYDVHDKKYKPVGAEQWLYIAETQRLTSQDRMFVLNTEKADEISNSGIGAATSMINRRTFDPNRPTSLYLPINYDQELEKIKSFLSKFESETLIPGSGSVRTHKYLNELEEIANGRRSTILIHLDDLQSFDEDGNEEINGLIQSIETNTHRYVDLFSQAIDSIMPESTINPELSQMDAVSVIASHRQARMIAKGIDTKITGPLQVPASLMRRYSVTFKARSKIPTLAVRQIHADTVGHMVKLRGIITRVTEVKPLLQVGTYTCEQCGYEIYQEVNSTAFMPLIECPSEECKSNGVHGQLFLQSRGSRFLKFQEARIQELTDQVPMGHIPRSMTVNLYGDLCRTCNPGDHVALLVLMVGGVNRTLPDGMRIRGDVNICLMGDPGVAKSQLLKYISKIAPRAVYTTGKGSSGVGLTAAVMKDPVTGEMILEGGALVLADNGICCIDEFDKMDENDRTAIHEVMEQQTISISKAGITTTLNARSSILAAANPLGGRYNPKKSPRDNINLPPALLSRFDLMFLILDTPDLDLDTRLAQHVTNVHRTGKSFSSISADEQQSTSNSGDLVPLTLLRRFLSYAKTLTPVVPSSLIDYITGAYVSLRLGDLSTPDSTMTTARTLLAILRLASAMAKLNLRESVSSGDVDEAMRLLQVSRSSVDIHRANTSHSRHRDLEATPTTRCYRVVCELALDQNYLIRRSNNDSDSKILSLPLVREKCRSRGFTPEIIENCLEEFDRLNIWALQPDEFSLNLVEKSSFAL